jgi:hypothetical protein
MDGMHLAMPFVLDDASSRGVGAEMSRRGLARHNAKRDANEPTIISAFEARGWTVVKLSGKGLPDLLCMKSVRRFGKPAAEAEHLLVDVKMPDGSFRPAQVETWKAWSLRGLPVYVAVTPEDVASIVSGEAKPWEVMEARPTRGKALVSVAANAGKRLRVVREPEGGEKRAPRPSYEPPRAHVCGKNGCRKHRPCEVHDGAVIGKPPFAVRVQSSGYDPERPPTPRASRTSPMSTKAMEPSNAAEYRALLAASEAEEAFAPGPEDGSEAHDRGEI